jgi:phenylpropionate dioxygenase-like ring-hydroxylating dioxygenase large terminal subunit
MSQSGLTAEHGVSWPSNGISEVPFRVYTDQDQYGREQERLFKGPTWNYLCLTVELAKPGDFVSTTVGETAVIVVRDAEGAINAFVNRCAPPRQPAVPGTPGQRQGIRLHLSRLDLQPGRPTDRRGVRARRAAPGRHAAGVPQGRAQAATLRVAVLGGLVFGTFSDATPDLETWLGADVTRGLLRVMNRTPHVLGRNTQVMPNNWKLYFENVKDTYHASILHLFLTTFRINRLTMPGGIYINQDGGNHYSFAKLDYAAEDAGIQERRPALGKRVPAAG